MKKIFRKLDIRLDCLLVCIYFLALPLTITTNASGASFLKILTIPIAGYLTISLFFSKEKLEFNIIHFFTALYLVSVVMTLFVARDHISMIYVRGYLQTIILMFIISTRKYTKNELEAFEITQIVLLALLISLGFTGADWYGDRNTMTLFGSTCDPNYFAGLYLFPIAVAMKKFRENKVYMILCPVLIAMGSYLVISSGSRGGLFALVVTIVAFIFINAKDTKQRIMGLIIAALVAAVMWTIIIPLLPESVSSRFDLNFLIKTRGTYRGDIWVSMINTIKNSTWELFIGRGISAQHEMLVNGRLTRVVAHNQFIQSMYNQGILGFVSFILLAFFSIFRNIKKRGYISAAMFGTLALAMTLTINPSIKTFWNLLIYSAFTYNVSTKNKGLIQNDIQ